VARVKRVGGGILEQGKDALQSIGSTVADAAKSAVNAIPGVGNNS
jgi:hypothetical protein